MRKRTRNSLFILALSILFSQQLLAAPGETGAWEYYFQINPHFGYSQANVFGSGRVPTYTGVSYGAEIAYLIGTPIFTLAPYFSYRQMGLDNTANSSASASSIDGSLLSYGLMLITKRVYLRAGVVQPKLEEKVSGNAVAAFQADQQGLELGAGITYPMSDYVWANLGLDINHIQSNTPVANNPRLDLMGYTLVFKVSFALPSGL